MLQVRRCVVPPEREKFSTRKRVFEQLGLLIEAGRLVLPRETYHELREGNKQLENPASDQPFSFAEKHKAALGTATFDRVKEVMSHELARHVVDPAAENDEADVFVLALALEIRAEGNEVGVLTQERRDTATKLSLNTACGLLGLVCLPMEAFLAQEGIWGWKLGS